MNRFSYGLLCRNMQEMSIVFICQIPWAGSIHIIRHRDCNIIQLRVIKIVNNQFFLTGKCFQSGNKEIPFSRIYHFSIHFNEASHFLNLNQFRIRERN